MDKNINRYIIRVYAIILNADKEVLISDEFQMNMKMTKFPGGGMHFGEGPVDCLKREAVEEFGQGIKILEHFYTTDFFQQAKFYNDAQLLSIYYLAEFTSPVKFKISGKSFDFKHEENGAQSFRWIKLKNIHENELTFPIDKHVIVLLKDKYLR